MYRIHLLCQELAPLPDPVLPAEMKAAEEEAAKPEARRPALKVADNDRR